MDINTGLLFKDSRKESSDFEYTRLLNALS